mmetsp:Transcript_14628/g.26487  ORF Transcript_14628/g.26487 Transcript_14628/m.26487 type:complete len:210 (-) Transcript_14628:460-1089(-)
MTLYPFVVPPRNALNSSVASKGADLTRCSQSFPNSFNELTSSPGIMIPFSLASSHIVPSGSNAFSNASKSIAFLRPGTSRTTKLNPSPGSHPPSVIASMNELYESDPSSPLVGSPVVGSINTTLSICPHAPSSCIASKSPKFNAYPLLSIATFTASFADASMEYNRYTSPSSSGIPFGNLFIATFIIASCMRRLSSPVPNVSPLMPTSM